MEIKNNKFNNPDLSLSMHNNYNNHNYYEVKNSWRYNLCSNQIINPKSCKYCNKDFCSKCIDEWLKNNKFCKICNRQMTSNAIIASSLNIINEKQQKNKDYKQIDNKVKNYCIQCDLEFSNEDKSIHINYSKIRSL